jgi:hypothetical protein
LMRLRAMAKARLLALLRQRQGGRGGGGGKQEEREWRRRPPARLRCRERERIRAKHAICKGNKARSPPPFVYVAFLPVPRLIFVLLRLLALFGSPCPGSPLF